MESGLLLTSRELVSFDIEKSINSDLDREIAHHLKDYPKSIFPLILSRAVERICYGLLCMSLAHLHGANATLSSELTVGLDSCLAGAVFLMAALAGATVADSYLGKLMTIFIFFVFYIAGAFTLMFSISPDKIPGLLVVIGAGGIAPCTMAFVGDQFIPFQSCLMDKAFSLMYGAGVLGLLIAQLGWTSISEFTPRNGIGFTCLLLSLAILCLGRYRTVVPPKHLLPWKIISLVSLATYRYFRRITYKKNAYLWLMYGKGPFSQELIGETRLFLKVAGCTLPMTLFWMLHTHVSFKCFISESNGYSLSLYITLGLIPILTFCVYPLLEQREMPKIIWSYFILIIAATITSITPLMPTVLLYTFTIIQIIFLSLSQAIVIPSLGLFAYSQTGRQLKSHSTLILIFTATLGKIFDLSLQYHLPSSLFKYISWIYLLLATLGFFCQLYIAKYIYISLEDELIQEEIRKLTIKSHPDWSLESDPILTPIHIIPIMY